MSELEITTNISQSQLLEILGTIPEELRVPLSSPVDFQGVISHLRTSFQTLNQQTGSGDPAELTLSLDYGELPSFNKFMEYIRQLVKTELKQGNYEFLFRPKEVPEFDDPNNYWEWRSSLLLFSRSVDVRPQQLFLAINRVLFRFTGKNLGFGNTLDAKSFVRATWEATITELIAYLDTRYLSWESVREQTERFKALRPEGQTGHIFILHFRHQADTVNEIARLVGGHTLSDYQIIQQFLDVIPPNICEYLNARKTDVRFRSFAEVAEIASEAWDITVTPKGIYEYSTPPVGTPNPEFPPNSEESHTIFRDKMCVFDAADQLLNMEELA
ncbi:hypothetical protein PT974_10302 [Cladobotryum mycophilum]|uniref:Uncharacterized protein n=1 Tax=Cladobotryum mycophilum TaxID=491253 RepID=A0ABR0S9G6_9HYPO